MARVKERAKEPPRRSKRLADAKASIKSTEKDKIPSKKSFVRLEQSKNCALVSWPPEVRNQIASLLLVKSHRIELKQYRDDDDEERIPAFLRVCKCIRNEYEAMFYKSNSFSIEILYFDGAYFEPFFRRAHLWFNIAETCHFIFEEDLSFDNLEDWIKLHEWSYPCIPESLYSNPANGHQYIVAGALAQLNILRGMPRATKDLALAGFLDTLQNVADSLRTGRCITC